MQVNLLNVYPNRVCLEVKEMSRNQCVYDLPLQANDYSVGEVKAWINGWFKRNFQSITLVTLYDADGGIAQDDGRNRCSITGTPSGAVKLDLSNAEHLNDFIQGHPYNAYIVAAAEAQMGH